MKKRLANKSSKTASKLTSQQLRNNHELTSHLRVQFFTILFSNLIFCSVCKNVGYKSQITTEINVIYWNSQHQGKTKLRKNRENKATKCRFHGFYKLLVESKQRRSCFDTHSGLDPGPLGQCPNPLQYHNEFLSQREPDIIHFHTSFYSFHFQARV